MKSNMFFDVAMKSGSSFHEQVHQSCTSPFHFRVVSFVYTRTFQLTQIKIDSCHSNRLTLVLVTRSISEFVEEKALGMTLSKSVQK